VGRLNEYERKLGRKQAHRARHSPVVSHSKLVSGRDQRRALRTSLCITFYVI